jgi:hypothetical protein
VATSTARLVIDAALDGQPVAGFPLERRLTVGALTASPVTRAADGDGVVTARPLATLGALLLLVVTADAPVRLALGGQTEDGTTDLGLGTDGLLLLAGLDGLASVTSANPTTIPAALTVVEGTTP